MQMKNNLRLLDVYDQPIETPLNHFLFQEIEEEVVEERFETALPPLSPPPPSPQANIEHKHEHEHEYEHERIALPPDNFVNEPVETIEMMTPHCLQNQNVFKFPTIDMKEIRPSTSDHQSDRKEEERNDLLPKSKGKDISLLKAIYVNEKEEEEEGQISNIELRTTTKNNKRYHRQLI